MQKKETPNIVVIMTLTVVGKNQHGFYQIIKKISDTPVRSLTTAIYFCGRSQKGWLKLNFQRTLLKFAEPDIWK